MNSKTMGRCVLAGFVLALAACSADNNVTTTSPNIPPAASYRSDIIDTLRKIFEGNGTVSVSDAFISDPVLNQGRYTACVRYTAHGANPGEIGKAERIAYFYGGRLNQLIEVTGDECARAAYKPFPELDQLCLGKGCSPQARDKGSGFSFGNLFNF